MSCRRICCSAAVFAVVAGSIFASSTSWGHHSGGSTGCVLATVVPDPLEPECKKAPTSLPCLDEFTPDPDGFCGDAESECGFKIRFFIFAVDCGRPLADAACINDVCTGGL